ncbi:MAG: hypothetical protein IJK28_09595 [Clostridia bacterium]|nr:hypothetical protein [Clostridia bacterium]
MIVLLCIALVGIIFLFALDLYIFGPYILAGITIAVAMYVGSLIVTKRKKMAFYRHCMEQGVTKPGDGRIRLIGEHYKIEEPFEVFQQMYIERHLDEYPKAEAEAIRKKAENKAKQMEALWYTAFGLIGAVVGLGVALIVSANVSYMNGEPIMIILFVLLGFLLSMIARKIWKEVRKSKDKKAELDRKLKEMNDIAKRH